VTLPAQALTLAADEVLASRARQGDHRAFDTLVGRHKRDIYRLVRRYVGNSDDAYDLLQDTFISVWENLHRYDPERSFLGWIRTIALNKCRDFSRRRRFRNWISQRFAAEPTAETPSPAEFADLAEGESQGKERLQRLDEAVAALPALYKEPLLLTTAGGLSQEAAAIVLKTTRKAVEMRVRRARQKLSDVLNQFGEK